MTIKPKQIDALFDSYLRIQGFTALGVDDVVTSVITTLLSTAGRGSKSVPLQVGSTSQIGIITTGTNNRVEIYSNATKQKLKDDNGNEVYGRLTESSNVYTLAYYSLVAGVETVYTFTSTSIDFEFTYRFDFDRLPNDFAIGISSRNINQDVLGSGGVSVREALSVTGTNVIASLAKTPIGGVDLVVNGVTEVSVNSPAPFTVSGKAITWSATNAAYSLETTDKVVAIYESHE